LQNQGGLKDFIYLFFQAEHYSESHKAVFKHFTSFRAAKLKDLIRCLNAQANIWGPSSMYVRRDHYPGKISFQSQDFE
jgi:hypothetical protein